MDFFHHVNVGVVCKVMKIRTVRIMLANENVKILTCVSVLLYLTFSFMLDHHLGPHIYIYIYIFHI